MDFNELKTSFTLVEKMAQQICERVYGNCVVESTSMVSNNKVEISVNILSLGMTVTLEVDDDIFNQPLEKAIVMFQMTDNIQRALIFNGILKGESLTIGVVTSNFATLSDFPTNLLNMLGIEKIEMVGGEASNVATIKFSHKITMIVGEILTSNGKQEQFKMVDTIKGRVFKVLNGNKSIFRISVDSVDCVS